MNASSCVEDDDAETLLLLICMNNLVLEFADSVRDAESLLVAHIREQRRLNRSLPAEKTRVPWDHFVSRISSTHFRRMFRMEESVFNKLCDQVCAAVGEDVFRPEKHLMAKYGELKGKRPPIAGEVKMAIAIRMLAGGSYLDLTPLFDVSSGHLYVVFDDVVAWIQFSFEFPLPRLLRERNWDAIHAMANLFAEKSNGVFFGPFASLDGLAVRMKCPSEMEVPDPGNYYCRKGFYALNVQACADMKKRFLWAYPSNKGSTHDSAAFAASRLHDLLGECAQELVERGLFVVGDSAYSLAPFLLTPYDTGQMRDDQYLAKDSFNYHLSACRIYIECAFGELIMRWGLFWRTLQYNSLKKCARVIEAAMLLHNFIVEHRTNSIEDSEYFTNFRVDVMDPIQLELSRQTGEIPRALVTDNNETARRGRRTIQEQEYVTKGSEVRHRLTVKLATYNRRRPLQHDMKYNSEGHIYLT